MNRNMFFGVILGLLTLVARQSCFGFAGTGLTYSTYTIQINGSSSSLAYSPDTITINSGDTVYWKFGNGTHSATCGKGSFCGLWSTITTSSGLSTPVTIFTIGTTIYYCANHPTTEFGVIIVNPPTTNATRWEFFSKEIHDDKYAPISVSLGDGPHVIYSDSPASSKPNEDSSSLLKLNNLEIHGSIQASRQLTHPN